MICLDTVSDRMTLAVPISPSLLLISRWRHVRFTDLSHRPHIEADHDGVRNKGHRGKGGVEGRGNAPVDITLCRHQRMRSSSAISHGRHLLRDWNMANVHACPLCSMQVCYALYISHTHDFISPQICDIANTYAYLYTIIKLNWRKT